MCYLSFMVKERKKVKEVQSEGNYPHFQVIISNQRIIVCGCACLCVRFPLPPSHSVSSFLFFRFVFHLLILCWP